MIRLTVPRTQDDYLSAYSKQELVHHLGIIEDVLEKTGDPAEDHRRWKRFYDYVMEENKQE